MTRTRLILLAVVATTVLAACETAKGVGRDIQNAGEAIDQEL